jgi:hypothetical protein
LLAPKELERSVKFLLIDLVSAGRHLSSRCHFPKAARLRRIQPDDPDRIDRSHNQPNNLNSLLPHVSTNLTTFSDHCVQVVGIQVIGWDRGRPARNAP